MTLFRKIGIFTGLLITLLCGSLVANAQVIKGAVIAGFNLSQVDGDEVYGFRKFGANVGASAIIPFTDHWEVSIETLFSQKGSRQGPQRDDSLSGEYKLKLNYVDIPVMVHYNDKDRLMFGLGISYGRLTGVEEYEHGRKIETTTIDGPYSRDDINGIADIRFRIYKGLKFNVRYAYSLKKIRTREFSPPNVDPWTRDQYNNFWSFRVIYVINEKQSERIKDENQQQ
ncbi:MAG: porin family protein [Bacteroidales bacterium]|nr:PorT family protein [Lentimicrobiaceae bacterium]MDD5695419.1 porin family protein [Bacteroidales bacterium]